MLITNGARPRNESFIDLYLEYTRDQESPDSFHLWTALTVLASAMGRKCFINKGYYQLYPNLFVVLVAGAAKCRKSTAINLGTTSPTGEQLFENITTTKIISGKITPEKLIREISEAQIINPDDPGHPSCPSIFIHSSELSVFLTKQSYGEPLIHILTDLFDCPKSWTNKTKNKGIDNLENVFVCILAATTPDGIAKGIPPSALNEGFASRVIWVYEEDTSRENALPELTPRQADLTKILKRMLEERAKLACQFTLSPSAKEAYKEWYHLHMNTTPPDKFLEGVWARKHDHLLRLGMILAANYLETVIEPGHLDAGLSILTNMESKVAGAFTSLGSKDSTIFLSRTQSFLMAAGRIRDSELLRRIYPCDSKEFSGIIETLIRSGKVDLDKEDPRVLIWRG